MVGSLRTAWRELLNVTYIEWECKRSYGRVVALNQQENTHFDSERGMRIMNWVQVFLHIRESYQQLTGSSFLATGCHT
jgi:hypothetical protein